MQLSCRYKKYGATLPEMLVILGILILTIIGAKFFHQRIEGFWGWLVGGVIGFSIIPLIFILYGLFMALFKEGIPYLPYCRNGRCCGYRDYDLKRFGEELYWVCKCGDRYDRKRTDRRFMQVTETGEKKPYMVWRSFRGWLPDEQGCEKRKNDS